MPPSRTEAQATLESGQAELDRLFEQLDDAALARPGTIGGEWSAKDLMGHIAFWEELALDAIDASRGGRRPRVDEYANADEANAENQAVTAPASVVETRARAASAHQAVLAALQSISDEEWTARPGFADAKEETLADLVGGALAGPNHPFGHAWAHMDDLRAYVASLNR